MIARILRAIAVRRKPSIANVARALAMHRVQSDRARIREVARELRRELNLPESEALRG